VVAAAASGGATIAPSVIAAASGNPANAQPIHATTAVVNSTATTASATKGRHNLRTAASGKSNAASSSTGAMNSASIMCPSIAISGLPGTNAMITPAAASIVG
jgi:hypothetical protein